MGTSLQCAILFAILILSLCISRANAIDGVASPFSATLSRPPPPQTPLQGPPQMPLQVPPQTPLQGQPQTPPPPQAMSHDLQDHSFFSHTALLAPILSHLGFNELAMAAPSLSSDSSATAWSGPSTLFAPSDSSLRTCFSCSVPNLLREHIVPGIFTIDYLRKLAFGTKIETLSPGRCITVTSTISKNDTASTSAVKVFIGGVEITHPDLFNNGLVVIHGIQGYIAPLSQFSCDVERLNSLTFPFHQPAAEARMQPHQPFVNHALMRLMLRDAMLRLRNNGFSILSLAMRVKYAELVSLSNMTVFALDDVSIFSGSHAYISSVRFHILPNQYLTVADLEKLPVGSTLPTLERGQSLVVTTAGGKGLTALPMRINYVRVKVPDVMRNLKIVVHSVYLPFPRIHPISAAYDEIMEAGGEHAEEACSAGLGEDGSCGVAPMPQVKATVVDHDDHDHDDHYGL